MIDISSFAVNKEQGTSNSGSGNGGFASSHTVIGQTVTVNNHTHTNKKDLDRLAVDNDGYVYVDDEKSKAGYADIAYDLTEDSPIRDQFLSKIHDDTAQGVITFDKWTEYGDYVPGSGGAYMGMSEVGSYNEVDFLKVRKKAQFETLEIAEVKYVGGKLIVAPGDGVEIIGVDEQYDGYVCYFKGSETDSEGKEKKVHNKFAVGDQIYCKIANIDEDMTFTNRYWWRLCTDVGEGYFKLSKKDCDYGSDAPMEGDKCAQLGNRHDLTRQSAIVLSTIEIGQSPLMALYGGIDSYSLEQREQVVMGADGEGTPYFNVFGKMYAGDRDGRSYIKYTPEDGVEIKAKISAQSTIGDTTVNEFISQTIIENITDDGVITPFEKQQLESMLLEIQQEYLDYSAKANELGIGIDDYTESFLELLIYLKGTTDELASLLLENRGFLKLANAGNILINITGVLSDMEHDSEIDRDEFKELFRKYFEERDKLQTKGLFGDYTQTVIDGGMITTGSIELKGASGVTHAGITGNEAGGDDDIRIWAGATKAERQTAPFRVNQGGEMWATNANIEGTIKADKLILGEKSGLVVSCPVEVLLPHLDSNTFRTIDVWILLISRTAPILIMQTENDTVWIGENIEPANIYSETSPSHCYHKYAVGVVGYYKLIGYGVNDCTYWDIIKLDNGNQYGYEYADTINPDIEL